MQITIYGFLCRSKGIFFRSQKNHALIKKECLQITKESCVDQKRIFSDHKRIMRWSKKNLCRSQKNVPLIKKESLQITKECSLIKKESLQITKESRSDQKNHCQKTKSRVFSSVFAWIPPKERGHYVKNQKKDEPSAKFKAPVPPAQERSSKSSSEHRS